MFAVVLDFDFFEEALFHNGDCCLNTRLYLNEHYVHYKIDTLY